MGLRRSQQNAASWRANLTHRRCSSLRPSEGAGAVLQAVQCAFQEALQAAPSLVVLQALDAWAPNTQVR